MNTDLSSSAICYGLYDENILIGFCAIIHFPHPKNPKIKHIHRLVIHPDYQGIGLGKKFLNFVSKLWFDKGYTVNIVTSARNLMIALNNDEHWGGLHYGRFEWSKSRTAMKALKQNNSENRITACFTYIK